MYLLKLKKSSLLLALIGLTGCCSKPCTPPCIDQEPIEIPCHWYSPLENGMTLEDPAEFHWWEALNDPLLTALIEQASFRNVDVNLAASQSKEKLLEAINTVAADVAKSYIELRGMQMRLKSLDDSIEGQTKIAALNEGLTDSGYISSFDRIENRRNLNALKEQKTLLNLSINKILFHLSTLLSYPPGCLFEMLSQPQALPKLPCEIPVGVPIDLIERHPTLQEARCAYESAPSNDTFLNYQKNILRVLEESENALAAFHSALSRIRHLENVRKLKADAHQLTVDLHGRGLKDDRDLLQAQQELLVEENALLEGQVELLISYVNLYQVFSGGWCVGAK